MGPVVGRCAIARGVTLGEASASARASAGRKPLLAILRPEAGAVAAAVVSSATDPAAAA